MINDIPETYFATLYYVGSSHYNFNSSILFSRHVLCFFSSSHKLFGYFFFIKEKGHILIMLYNLNISNGYNLIWKSYVLKSLLSFSKIKIKFTFIQKLKFRNSFLQWLPIMTPSQKPIRNIHLRLLNVIFNKFSRTFHA